MAAKPVKIAILADASEAVSGFNRASSAAESAGGRFEGVAEKSDKLASTSSQVAGGMGDLGGALAALPGPLGALGTAMEASQVAIMGVTGASDLMNAVTEKFPALAGRSGAAAGGMAKGVGAASKAQKALNLATRAFPVLAIIAAIVLVVQNWDKIKAAIGRVVGAIRDFVPKALAKIREFVGAFLGIYGRIYGKIFEIGKDIIRGLWEGLKSMAGWIKDKVIGLVSDILPGPVKKILGIASPSKVFKQYGKYTGQGLALGIEQSYGRVSRAAGGLAGAVAGGFSAPSLELSARTAFAGSSPAGLGGDTFNLNVSVPATANPVEVGRAIVRAIEAYKRAGGR